MACELERGVHVAVEQKPVCCVLPALQVEDSARVLQGSSVR